MLQLKLTSFSSQGNILNIGYFKFFIYYIYIISDLNKFNEHFCELVLVDDDKPVFHSAKKNNFFLFYFY